MTLVPEPRCDAWTRADRLPRGRVPARRDGRSAQPARDGRPRDVTDRSIVPVIVTREDSTACPPSRPSRRPARERADIEADAEIARQPRSSRPPTTADSQAVRSIIAEAVRPRPDITSIPMAPACSCATASTAHARRHAGRPSPERRVISASRFSASWTSPSAAAAGGRLSITIDARRVDIRSRSSPGRRGVGGAARARQRARR